MRKRNILSSDSRQFSSRWPRLADRSDGAVSHADQDGPCGYEFKDRGFTGFAPCGEKGLWVSGVRQSDTALVIAESALDARSYAALHPDASTRYASIGGKLNPTQPTLIRSAFERLQTGAVLRIATDNDKDGAVLGAEIAQLAAETGRADLNVEFAVPAGAKDWNDVLRRESCLRSA